MLFYVFYIEEDKNKITNGAHCRIAANTLYPAGKASIMLRTQIRLSFLIFAFSYFLCCRMLLISIMSITGYRTSLIPMTKVCYFYTACSNAFINIMHSNTITILFFYTSSGPLGDSSGGIYYS